MIQKHKNKYKLAWSRDAAWEAELAALDWTARVLDSNPESS